MHRHLLATLILPLAALGGTGPATPPDAQLTPYRDIALWDVGRVPGAKGDGPLDAPFLTVFLPRAGTANGGAVVVAPGGGNIMLMYGGEGGDVAEVFNDWGVTAFVLTYRLAPR
jgi:acetyl esterase/lipase